MSDTELTSAEKLEEQIQKLKRESRNLMEIFDQRELELRNIITAVAEEKEKWEEEKRMIAKTQEFGSIVKLNVGGTMYATSLATLSRFPESMLGAMFSRRNKIAIEDDGAVFIDRNGQQFGEI